MMKTSLPEIFSSHMVLQREMPVPIWGNDAPGTLVTAQIAGQTKKSQADASGHWLITFDPLSAGGPHKLTVKGTSETILQDILIGDVWFASGQSQMRSELARVTDAKNEIEQTNCSQIRIFQVPFVQSTRPLDRVEGTWQVCEPETVAGFSAMAWFFGRRIHRETGVPIGLINASIGGSKIEAFLSPDGLRAFPKHNYSPLLENLETRAFEEVDAEYRDCQTKWQESVERLKKVAAETDAGIQDGKPLWTAPDFDDSDWNIIHLPGVFGEQSMPVAGSFWLRRTFELPLEGAQLSELHLGFISDRDTIWINGNKIEGLDRYDAGRIYRVAGSSLRPGLNSIVLRIISPVAGAVYAAPDGLRLVNDRLTVRLSGKWKCKNGSVVNAGPPPSYVGVRSYTPCLLYNAMIHPFIQMAIKGVIWSQGEANTAESGRYESLMRSLIDDWRRLWKSPDLPFVWEQTTSDGHPDDAYPHESMRAEIRDAQRRVLNMPQTGMAQLIDIAGVIDLHYLDKKTAGERMAQAALSMVYGKPVLPGGPLYHAHCVQGSKMILEFSDTGGQLKTRGDQPLRGFTIAGANRKFYQAESEINDKKVEVHSPNVPDPVAVRYAWSSNPASANLVNAENFPAGTFRTDDWPCLGSS